MSIAAMNWAFGAAVEPSGAKFVLVALADHADADGHCYPSQDLLAVKTGQTARSVRTHLARLEADGWIARSKRRKAGKQTSDAYDLTWRRESPQAEDISARSETPERGPHEASQAENSSAGTGASQAEKNVVSGGKLCLSQAENISAEPSKNHQEPCARAREGRPCGAADPRAPSPAGDAGEAGETASGSASKPPPACAVWRERWQALSGTIAAPLARYCIPEHDSGAVLTLAVAAPGVGFAVLAWAAPVLAQVLDREIACAVRAWVGPALRDRGFETQARLGGSARHRRDGEILSLTDPAWRAWDEAGARLGERAALAREVLPDDIDDDGVMNLNCNTVALMTSGDAAAWLARALGCPVKLGIGFWIECALEVRDKTEGTSFERKAG